MHGALFVDAILRVVVGGDFAALPPDSDHGVDRVPLHALRGDRAMDGRILQQLTLKKYVANILNSTPYTSVSYLPL